MTSGYTFTPLFVIIFNFILKESILFKVLPISLEFFPFQLIKISTPTNTWFSSVITYSEITVSPIPKDNGLSNTCSGFFPKFSITLFANTLEETISFVFPS